MTNETQRAIKARQAEIDHAYLEQAEKWFELLATREAPASAWADFSSWLSSAPDHLRYKISQIVSYDERLATKRHLVSGGNNDASYRRIAQAPGSRVAAIARFLLTRTAYKRYVEPVIADLQHEYIEALAAGHLWHARWIAVRGHLLVIPGWVYAFLAGKLLRRGH